MNSKLFKQLIINNIFEEKKSKKIFLSKDKNLTSARKKIRACNQEFKKYNRDSTEKKYLLDNINYFNLKTSTSKKKNNAINTKKIKKELYNSKKNSFNKKLAISKKEMIKIVNHNLSNSKKERNLSIISVRSEGEEKTKYQEKYINKLSHELILPSNKENIYTKNTSHKKIKNRNYLSPIKDGTTTMTYISNFTISNKINNNTDDDNQIIKVNLNENKKANKNIKKDASYALSNSNTNSNTNSRNITNYFNDNKINKNALNDINNFNKDIKEIINIKESISLLKEQLKVDNNICNLTYINNKINLKRKKNKLKNNHYYISTRNEIKTKYLNTSESFKNMEINKINDIKIDSAKNKKTIYINNNKSKLNLKTVFQKTKDKNHSSINKTKFNENNKSFKNFFYHEKNYKYEIKNNSNKNISIKDKKRNNVISQKSFTKYNNSNISKIYKNNKIKNHNQKIDSPNITEKGKNNLNKKIKKLSKNQFLMTVRNNTSKKIINKYKSNYKIKIIQKKKIILDSNFENKIAYNNQNILKFKFDKNKNNHSLDIKLNNENKSFNFKTNKSQLLLPLCKKNKKIKNIHEITKNIDKIEIISKPGETIFGKVKINQDNYFNYDLINNYKLIGVCDGHGENGHHVSEFIKKNLPIELNNQLKKTLYIQNIINSLHENNNIKNNFIEFKKLKEILINSYLITNNKLLLKDNINHLNLKLSGSTCVSILMDMKNKNKLYISNIGDSRAIIIKEMKNNYWTCQQLSRDHKPIEKDESSRIYKCGGEIQKIEDENGGWTGPLRVWAKNERGPGLAMTRSFGDILGSSIGIICLPEINEYIIKKEDRAIIIASDGLWEYVSNKETINIVKKSINKNDNCKIVNQLYREAFKKWKQKNKGIDDITIICIILKNE